MMATPAPPQARAPWQTQQYPAAFLHDALAEPKDKLFRVKLFRYVDPTAWEKIEAVVQKIGHDEIITASTLVARAERVNGGYMGPCLRYVLDRIAFQAWRRHQEASGTTFPARAHGSQGAHGSQEAMLSYLLKITFAVLTPLPPPERDEQQDEERYLQGVAKWLFTTFRYWHDEDTAKFPRLKFIAQEYPQLEGLFPRTGKDATHPLSSDRLRKLFLAMRDLFIVEGPVNEWSVKATDDHSKTIEAIKKSLPKIPQLNKQEVVDHLRSQQFRDDVEGKALSSPDLQQYIRCHFELGPEMSGQVRSLVVELPKMPNPPFSFEDGKVRVVQASAA